LKQKLKLLINKLQLLLKRKKRHHHFNIFLLLIYASSINFIFTNEVKAQPPVRKSEPQERPVLKQTLPTRKKPKMAD